MMKPLATLPRFYKLLRHRRFGAAFGPVLQDLPRWLSLVPIRGWQAHRSRDGAVEIRPVHLVGLRFTVDLGPAKDGEAPGRLTVQGEGSAVLLRHTDPDGECWDEAVPWEAAFAPSRLAASGLHPAPFRVEHGAAETDARTLWPDLAVTTRGAA